MNCRGDRGDVRLGVRAGLLEQPPPDDLERLVARRRPPLVGDPPDDVLQPVQRRAPVRPAHLDVARAAVHLLSDGVEDAGIETTSIAPGIALTTSVSVWANVNWVSNVPPARSSRP